MKNLTLLFILIPCLVFGQKKAPAPHPPTIEEDKLADKHNQCHYNFKYNAERRRSFFPFNTATTIQLVSFNDTVRIYTPIAVNYFNIDYSKVIETKKLSQAGVDSLTDIMYNYGLTPVKGTYLETADPGAACYNPRNAILFMDAEGRVTQYIEFCFECHRYYLSSSKIKNATYCEQKYDLLKTYFLAQGLKYGTILPKRESN
ncbi:MAG: hypothetical protein ACXVB0_12205 [Mucilaginibacter sp.]